MEGSRREITGDDDNKRRITTGIGQEYRRREGKVKECEDATQREVKRKGGTLGNLLAIDEK